MVDAETRSEDRRRGMRGPVFAVLLVVIVAAAVLLGRGNAGWTDSTSAERLAREGVVYLTDPPVFLVHTEEGPIALSALVPHLPGDRALYCPSSGWFEEIGHGSKFDGVGIYADGPANRSLDLFATRVRNGHVQFALDRITQRPRNAAPRLDPDGPFCSNEAEMVEGPPGFAQPPR